MKEMKAKKLKIALLRVTDKTKMELESLLVKNPNIDLITNNTSPGTVNSVLKQAPELIMMEWWANEYDNKSLLTEIRRHQALTEVPVMVITNMGNVRAVSQAKMLGAVEVIYTPINPQILFHNLSKVFPKMNFNNHFSTFEDLKSIKTKINSISELAPLPLLAKKVMEISDDPNSSALNLGLVIKKDQALTSKVLKIVNSAYYGFYRQIGNIDQAIVILGFNEVKNITIATSLIQTFHWNISQRINREKFWIHSLGCALIARSLCLAKLELNPEDAFVAGLLHDVGKIILYQYFPENYNTVLRIAQKQRRPLFEVCRDLMEIDHAEVGGMVAESWKFPPTLVNAIQFHHKPENAAPEDYYIHLTHLANYFCHNEEIGESGTPKVQEPFSGSMEALDIKERRLNRILTSFKLDNEFISNLI